MAPIYVKGGVWTNVEDAILKAAISKYGLNQWARVSSLLEKKTAKQCKMRWQEWLDPRIRKIEWTVEEDRKLLELARLRPNQWNSVSMLMNRTANQCIERYQQLLDDNLDDSDLKLTGNMKEAAQGVNSLNLNPESKPARPDLEEMDDDEREMWSEARARLANTKGKKAKRKARERMVAESRRVALIQKRRELKQAGINSRFRTKKKFATQMDYNSDVAFARVPEEGRFDTHDEDVQNHQARLEFDSKAERNQLPNQEFEKQERKRRRQEQEQATTFEGAAQTYDDELEFKKRRMQLSAPDGADDLADVDLDGEIKSAAKDLHRSTHERSVLFTKGAENESEDDEDSLPRVSLRSKLANLPAPLNDFEIDESEAEEGVADLHEGPRIDASVRPRVAVLGGREQVACRGLPVPDKAGEIVGLATGRSGVAKLVLEELARVISGDVGEIDNEDSVQAAIEAELEHMDYNVYKQAVETPAAIDVDEQISQIGAELDQISKKTHGLEKKFAVFTNGYVRNQAGLLGAIGTKAAELTDLDREVYVYNEIQVLENQAINTRSQVLQENLGRLTEAVDNAEKRLL
ncbi:hypothetical protein OGAPHI_000759 [Ogataea philodendri]|uniref:Pre-mRNA-splicing factor CEF1 n=1 Tax=Ogataea philodendri TaxID=1378263 RepID=A0A9P8PF03_9ASCO|nr:uncharacterized protein OGAPHI_000759 [Ogataea philodendri]KAH3671048.1 hypothetical protein OGAPHI_000759 [Ogataea philodendri]